jgi:hypothetical protein
LAESAYESARQFRVHAAWLTRRPDRWAAATPGTATPAWWERQTHQPELLADTYLSLSFDYWLTTNA